MYLRNDVLKSRGWFILACAWLSDVMLLPTHDQVRSWLLRQCWQFRQLRPLGLTFMLCARQMHGFAQLLHLIDCYHISAYNLIVIVIIILIIGIIGYIPYINKLIWQTTRFVGNRSKRLYMEINLYIGCSL